MGSLQTPVLSKGGFGGSLASLGHLISTANPLDLEQKKLLLSDSLGLYHSTRITSNS